MANNSGGGLGLAGILIILLVAWGIIEFIGAYWQILLAVAAVGLLVYVVFNSGKKPANIPEENFKYEVKQTKPQLAPMPYSERKPAEPIKYEIKQDETQLPPMPYSSDYVSGKKNKQVEQKIEDAEAKLKELETQIEHREEIIAEMVAESLSRARGELDRIQGEIDKREFYLNEVEKIKENLAALQKKETSLIEKIDALMRVRKSVNAAITQYFRNVGFATDMELKLPPEVIREVDTLAPSLLLKLHSMDYKDLRRAFKGNEKIIEQTLARYENRYTTKVNRAIYRLMVIALRAELQNILYTLTSTKLNDALAAVRDVTNKYLNIAREGNQTISSTLAKFIGELEPLFIDAVKIEYEYYVKREAARQEQLELRAKMREEAEEARRLKEQQEQMEREESKFNTEIENLLEQARATDDDAKNQALLDKVRALELQLAELETKKEEIIRLQNGKAGYVYVISNLGSFGDDVFKVGMTRRLNPQERIDELGSASLPFKFDVHSFIFSEDAVKLEADLHAALDSRRLNKVNLRKEFFKITLDELETSVESFDPTAEFNRTMQAGQNL